MGGEVKKPPWRSGQGDREGKKPIQGVQKRRWLLGTLELSPLGPCCRRCRTHLRLVPPPRKVAGIFTLQLPSVIG